VFEGRIRNSGISELRTGEENMNKNMLVIAM
jgi:hypothetical protein